LKRAIKFSFIIICILCVAGCSRPLFAPPTETPTATRTPTLTATATLTTTPTKTFTATPSPAVELGERHVINEGRFSVQVPIGYAAQIEERQAFISDLEGTLIISLAGVESTSSEEEIIDEYLDALAKRSEGTFEKTPSDPVTVAGVEGKAFDLTGSIFGSPLKGKTFIIPVGSGRFLYGLGISNLSQDEAAWEEHGSKVFEAVVESIEFVEPGSTDVCPIATDTTYGYTKENAIRVGDGGELFGGPARERAYLDNLRGPNGELIAYERTGSLNFEDTILDEYVITGLATPVTLYLDIYKFEELKAPIGFTCVGPFDLKP
jgi:hypothetical protein